MMPPRVFDFVEDVSANAAIHCSAKFLKTQVLNEARTFFFADFCHKENIIVKQWLHKLFDAFRGNAVFTSKPSVDRKMYFAIALDQCGHVTLLIIEIWNTFPRTQSLYRFIIRQPLILNQMLKPRTTHTCVESLARLIGSNVC